MERLITPHGITVSYEQGARAAAAAPGGGLHRVGVPADAAQPLVERVERTRGRRALPPDLRKPAGSNWSDGRRRGPALIGNERKDQSRPQRRRADLLSVPFLQQADALGAPRLLCTRESQENP